MSPSIIDSHTHLTDPAFAPDLDAVIARAKEAGVTRVINAADTVASIAEVVRLAELYPDFCFSALGIHPNEVKGAEDLQVLGEALREGAGNIVAVGEIGLDFHYDPSPAKKDLQIVMFNAQIDRAVEAGLPIVVHTRDADFLTYDLLCGKKPPVPVVLHCYGGSRELARRYLASGLDVYFGIGGVLTFKNARKLVETVINLPPERLVLETDAPYLAPSPHRGQRNEPAMIRSVLDKVAELKRLSVEETAKLLYATTERIFFHG